MPYRSISQLPKRVKDNLPAQAKQIYKSAYNSAYEEYKKPEDRRGDADREETAHKVAWSAVKKKYKKQGDEWVSKTTH